MSIESYIKALPKAELHVHLDGGVSKEALLVIAEQNEISEQARHFRDWVALLDKPDYTRLDELLRITGGWVQIPEDLTRMVYDLGVSLSKQNVRYAEVQVNPSLYPDLNPSDLDEVINALRDGANRAEKAWGIEMMFILTIPRDEPRRADEYYRFALTAPGRRGGAVAIGLAGKESSQPTGQFERAFSNAAKREFARVPHGGDELGAEGVMHVLDDLSPTRIADGWGIIESQDVIQRLTAEDVPVDVSMASALRTGKIESYGQYPLQQLYSEGVTFTLGSDMPFFLKTTLNEQYLMAHEQCGLSLEELEDVALNAVRVSLLPDDKKQAMLEDFMTQFQALRAEHGITETAE